MQRREVKVNGVALKKQSNTIIDSKNEMKYKVNGVGRRRLDGAKSGQTLTEAQSQQICPKFR